MVKVTREISMTTSQNRQQRSIRLGEQDNTGVIGRGVSMVTGDAPTQRCVEYSGMLPKGCFNSSQSYVPSTLRCLGNIFAIRKQSGSVRNFSKQIFFIVMVYWK